MITLRDYQREAVNSLNEYRKKGGNRGLIAVPTGGGKTVIFNYFIAENNLKALVLAHRDELLTQAVEKWQMVVDGWKDDRKSDVGKIAKSEWEIAGYTVASVQTLLSNTHKLKGLAKNFDIIVVDEAHHYVAKRYLEVLKTLLEEKKDLFLLGVTATPFRSDGISLQTLFTDLVYKIDILELMKKGYLVPVKGRFIPLRLEQDFDEFLSISRNTGDFSLPKVATVFNTEKVNVQIVEKWREYAEDRKTIFYLSSLEHAESLRDVFIRNGIKAEMVSGSMPLSERRQILKDFKDGKIQVLTNMNVLTEGFDDPTVNCIGIVRPTKSLNLYAQIVGRGLRIALNKEDCLILDYCGISKKHTIVALPDLFGIDTKEPYWEGEVLQVGSVMEGDEPKISIIYGDKEVEFYFDGKEALEYACEVEINGIKHYFLSLNMHESLVLIENGDTYNLYKVGGSDGVKKPLKILKENLPKDYAFSVMTAVWKKEMDDFITEFSEVGKAKKITMKQKRAIKNWLKYSKNEIILKQDIDSLNRFHASSLLSFLFASNLYYCSADLFFKEIDIRNDEQIKQIVLSTTKGRFELSEREERLIREILEFYPRAYLFPSEYINVTTDIVEEFLQIYKYEPEKAETVMSAINFLTNFAISFDGKFFLSLFDMYFLILANDCRKAIQREDGSFVVVKSSPLPLFPREILRKMESIFGKTLV